MGKQSLNIELELGGVLSLLVALVVGFVIGAILL